MSKLARILWIITEVCSNRGFLPGLWENYQKKKVTGKPDAETLSSSSCDMEGHAKKCVERYCELTNKQRKQFYKVATPCLDDHQFREEENGTVVKSSTVWSQMVLKGLYLDRIGGPDVLRSVNKLASAVTKWTRACDKRLARLISHFHAFEYRQYCYVGNTAQQCSLGLFQDSDFEGDLEDSKVNFGWNSVHFRKPNICASKLDVQETNLSFTQFYGRFSNLAR